MGMEAETGKERKVKKETKHVDIRTRVVKT